MVEVKGKAEEAKGKAQAALDKATATKKNIERSNNDLRDLIKQIRDFLTRESYNLFCVCLSLQVTSMHPSSSVYLKSGCNSLSREAQTFFFLNTLSSSFRWILRLFKAS